MPGHFFKLQLKFNFENHFVLLITGVTDQHMQDDAEASVCQRLYRFMGKGVRDSDGNGFAQKMLLPVKSWLLEVFPWPVFASYAVFAYLCPVTTF